MPTAARWTAIWPSPRAATAHKRSWAPTLTPAIPSSARARWRWAARCPAPPVSAWRPEQPSTCRLSAAPYAGQRRVADGEWDRQRGHDRRACGWHRGSGFTAHRHWTTTRRIRPERFAGHGVAGRQRLHRQHPHRAGRGRLTRSSKPAAMSSHRPCTVSGTAIGLGYAGSIVVSGGQVNLHIISIATPTVDDSGRDYLTAGLRRHDPERECRRRPAPFFFFFFFLFLFFFSFSLSGRETGPVGAQDDSAVLERTFPLTGVRSLATTFALRTVPP